MRYLDHSLPLALLRSLAHLRYNAHMATDQHLSVAEAADLLGVHQATVKRWIRNGKLPAERIGHGKGIWLIRSNDVDELAAAS